MIWKDGILYTTGKSIKGDRVFGKLRVWPPERSKLAALYYLGVVPDINKTNDFLYLGAASGTTVSFLADYTGIIYAVEIAPEPLFGLLEVVERKKNVIPIPADASKPEIYSSIVSNVDFLYIDIAQRNQAEIAVRNLFFLKSGGYLIMMLKTRSVSAHEDSEKICKETVDIFLKAGMCDFSVTWLEKYHRGHVAIVCRKRFIEKSDE
jgi:fibrillarin-like pre-rRNA processing protein